MGEPTRQDWHLLAKDLTAYIVPDSPKMLHETLCVAQARISKGPDDPRKREHLDRLQRLIDECERHRPLGVGGKHGDLHTPTCGCDRAPAPFARYSGTAGSKVDAALGGDGGAS